jgi:hypothetical protein
VRCPGDLLTFKLVQTTGADQFVFPNGKRLLQCPLCLQVSTWVVIENSEQVVGDEVATPLRVGGASADGDRRKPTADLLPALVQPSLESGIVAEELGGQEDKIAVSLLQRGEYSNTYKVPTDLRAGRFIEHGAIEAWSQ